VSPIEHGDSGRAFQLTATQADHGREASTLGLVIEAIEG
jgi:hypothetical protein